MNREIARQFEEVSSPIIVATHPRSGTHLMIDLLRRQFEACKAWLWPGETLHHLYVDVDRLSVGHPEPMSVEEAVSLLGRAKRPTVKTHSLPSLPSFEGEKCDLAEELIERGDILYIVRDGRDALCSTHIWKKEDEPELADYNLSEFLRLKKRGLSRVRYWAEHVKQWTKHPDVKVIRFEDILSASRGVVESLANELDMDPLYETPYLPEQVQGGRWTFYWRRLVRNFESTAILGRPNGREPANWEEAFTESDRRFFWEEAGSVLRQFGYELDDSWVVEGREPKKNA
jgi:hypothetical protein